MNIKMALTTAWESVLVVSLLILFLVGCVETTSSPSNEDKILCEGRIWVKVSIFAQCQELPWQDEGVDSFFETKGIKVYEINISYMGVCEGCGCPRREIIKIQTDCADEGKLWEVLKDSVRQGYIPYDNFEFPQ